jgi:hypothetical protein
MDKCFPPYDDSDFHSSDDEYDEYGTSRERQNDHPQRHIRVHFSSMESTEEWARTYQDVIKKRLEAHLNDIASAFFVTAVVISFRNRRIKESHPYILIGNGDAEVDEGLWDSKAIKNVINDPKFGLLIGKTTTELAGDRFGSTLYFENPIAGVGIDHDGVPSTAAFFLKNGTSSFGLTTASGTDYLDG